MKKTILMAVLFSLFIGIWVSCGNAGEEKSLKTLLPDLKEYGFVEQEITEWNKEQLDEAHNSVAKQFGLNISVKDAENAFPGRLPIGRIQAGYKKSDMIISLRVDEYIDEEAALNICDGMVNSAEELKQNNLFPGISIELKKVKLNGHTAYYRVNTNLNTKIGQTSLFWSKGPYTFELMNCSEIVWEESEIIKVAEKIKY